MYKEEGGVNLFEDKDDNIERVTADIKDVRVTSKQGLPVGWTNSTLNALAIEADMPFEELVAIGKADPDALNDLKRNLDTEKEVRELFNKLNNKSLKDAFYPLSAYDEDGQKVISGFAPSETFYNKLKNIAIEALTAYKLDPSSVDEINQMIVEMEYKNQNIISDLMKRVKRANE